MTGEGGGGRGAVGVPSWERSCSEERETVGTAGECGTLGIYGCCS